MVMDHLILFHKPNKKVRSEKMMDHLISQTKHTISSSPRPPARTCRPVASFAAGRAPYETCFSSEDMRDGF
jgi:hypothetical protein